MINKCPGQDARNITVELIRCLGCGYSVEIFSDEAKVRCSRCKGLIYRERKLSCLDWCKGAKECLGEEKWKELKGGN